MKKNTIWLWFIDDAEEAARFYARTFSDSKVGAVRRAPADFPGGKAGDVLTVEFTVCGVDCAGREAKGVSNGFLQPPHRADLPIIWHSHLWQKCGFETFEVP